MADDHAAPAGARGGRPASSREGRPPADLSHRAQAAPAGQGLAGAGVEEMRSGGAMAAKKKAKAKTVAKAKTKGNDVPQFFRLSVEVGDLEAGIRFYSKLLDFEGRKQPGARCYFEAGPVTLSVLDVSSSGKPHPAAKALYFTVRDLDAAFARAKALNCLSR